MNEYPTDHGQDGGILPLQSDCAGLASKIEASSTTYNLAPGACATASYNTCISEMCSVCNGQGGYTSADWSNAVQAITARCVKLPYNEVGTAYDSGNFDIFWAVEASGDVLPSYTGACPPSGPPPGGF